jgi:hypothetical protein
MTSTRLGCDAGSRRLKIVYLSIILRSRFVDGIIATGRAFMPVHPLFRGRPKTKPTLGVTRRWVFSFVPPQACRAPLEAL